MNTTSELQFFCYSPRPVQIDLPAKEHAVWSTLRRALGIFRFGGMEVPMVKTLTKKRWPGDEPPTEVQILAQLLKLRERGIAEQVTPERWRLTATGGRNA